MPHASLSISPRPEHVRIARMMAVSLARRSGVPDGQLDEIRIAVGEAASRAVQIHVRTACTDPVRFHFTEDDRGYGVDVYDVGEPDVVPDDIPELVGDAAGGSVDLDVLPPGLDLAVVAGFVDELEVAADPVGGTVVRLRWTR